MWKNPENQKQNRKWRDKTRERWIKIQVKKNVSKRKWIEKVQKQSNNITLQKKSRKIRCGFGIDKKSFSEVLKAAHSEEAYRPEANLPLFTLKETEISWMKTEQTLILKVREKLTVWGTLRLRNWKWGIKSLTLNEDRS